MCSIVSKCDKTVVGDESAVPCELAGDGDGADDDDDSGDFERRAAVLDLLRLAVAVEHSADGSIVVAADVQWANSLS